MYINKYLKILNWRSHQINLGGDKVPELQLNRNIRESISDCLLYSTVFKFTFLNKKAAIRLKKLKK